MPDRILVPLIVACALFMENLDATVISTALPAIAADFGTSPIHLKLALTSYLLAIAIFLPVSGWLADRHGARLIFRLAIAIFTAGSILCGFSNSIGMIVFARVVQGIGGAMMVPVGRLVILRTVPKHELVGSLAWLTVPALIGPVIGPPVGGFITTYADWPWIFWINIPVGLLGLVLATLYIPDIRGETRVAFDRLGFALSALGLAAFMTGSTTLGLGLLPIPIVLLLLFGGAALLAAYVLHGRRIREPILDLTLLRLPTFRYSLTGALLFRIGMGATPFLLPLLLQVGFGMTAFQSGMITFAAAVGAIAMKFVAPPILKRYGFRNVLLWNTAVAAGFVALPAAFTPTTPVGLMTGLLLIGGFFRSLQFTSINALAFADVPAKRMSRATTLTSVGQQLSLSVGISVGAVALELATRTTGGEITYASFWPAFLLVGVITLCSLIPFRRLSADAGDEMSGRQRIAPDPVTAMRERG
ncbi:MAG: DHA2 family efflux MFS transporter permease subunit [Bauldia sp.]|nr:DHA2 family efflux MFS transporter permease subunit [Bauldia sp.]